MQMKIKEKSTGFTLIEILVVLAILSILTGLISSNYITSRIRARDAQRKSDLSSIKTALELFYNDHGQYPPAAISGVGNSQISTIDWGDESFYDFINDETETIYMAILPGDPAAPGTQYFYTTNSTGTKYQLCAQIENEEDSAIQQDYADRVCSEDSATNLCNYCVASSNATLDEEL